MTTERLIAYIGLYRVAHNTRIGERDIIEVYA